MTKSICFAVSTLPASFIKLQADALGIKKVVVVSKPLLQSYATIRQKNPKIKLSLVPKGFLFLAAYLFFTIVLARITNTKIVFFHECCFPMFDILVKMIRPDGMFFPQVTMTGYERVSYEDFPRGKTEKLLSIFNLEDLFTYYRGSSVGSDGFDFALSSKSYPESIAVYDSFFSRDLLNANKTVKKLKRKIVFLVGKSMVLDVHQVDLYKELIRMSISLDFECYVKDHPNPKFRLNMDSDAVVVLDPLVPVEMIDDDFSVVVGTSSTGLLNFGDRAISLIDVISEITPEDVVYLKDHFYQVDPKNLINFIRNINDFNHIISGIKL